MLSRSRYLGSDTLYLLFCCPCSPGETAWPLPDNVGIPLGPGSGFQSFYLNTHYDNPEGLEGVQDSSGVRVYYSKKPREHAAAVLMLGDPFITLYGQPLGAGISEHTFL